MKKRVPRGLALALLPAYTFVVDGIMLINQATVTAAGGIYTIIQPGRYKLSGNLIALPNQTAIVVAQSHVSIDLNG